MVRNKNRKRVPRTLPSRSRCTVQHSGHDFKSCYSSVLTPKIIKVVGYTISAWRTTRAHHILKVDYVRDRYHALAVLHVHIQASGCGATGTSERKKPTKRVLNSQMMRWRNVVCLQPHGQERLEPAQRGRSQRLAAAEASPMV